MRCINGVLKAEKRSDELTPAIIAASHWVSRCTMVTSLGTRSTRYLSPMPMRNRLSRAASSRRLQFAQLQGGLHPRQSFSFNDPVFRSSISTKPLSWSYEREWRYVEETSGSFDFPGDLVSIAYGYRMSKDRRDHYTTLLQQSGFRADRFEVRISPAGAFEVVPLP